MAIVFAFMDTMPPFQDNLDMLAAPLSRQASCKEDLILRTKKGIENGIVLAEEQKQRALEAYEAAQEILRQEEERVAEINRSRDSNSDSEPATVPEYYYTRVEETENEYDRADECVTRAYQTQEDYNSYCDSYRAEQLQAVEEYNRLLEKSRNFFEAYIETLVKAKEAISHGSNAGAEGEENGQGGISVAVDENTRSLTKGEAIALSKKTGWTIKTIQLKCSISHDGTIHYKTINSDYENRLHPSGVYFQRSIVKIRGVEVEGVFPKFDFAYEITKMPEDLWNVSGTKYTDQFTYCNEQLKTAIQNEPVLASQFSSMQRDQILSGSTPAGYTWHHHQEPGRMQLVRKQEHNPPAGGANHTGGALWCR